MNIKWSGYTCYICCIWGSKYTIQGHCPWGAYSLVWRWKKPQTKYITNVRVKRSLWDSHLLIIQVLSARYLENQLLFSHSINDILSIQPGKERSNQFLPLIFFLSPPPGSSSIFHQVSKWLCPCHILDIMLGSETKKKLG